MQEEDFLQDGLLQLARKGDEAAFARIIREYQRLIYSIAYRYTQNQADAEELVNDVFWHAFQAIKSFRGGNFPAWLKTIANNLGRDWFRKRYAGARDPRKEFPVDERLRDPHGLSEATIDSKKALEFLRAAISVISERIPAFELCVIQGMKYADAAAILHCSEGKVRSGIHRARESLKDQLGKYGLAAAV